MVAQTCLVIALYDSPNTPACAHHDHGDIIDAIEAKNAELAAQRMVSHLNCCENALHLEEDTHEAIDLRAIFE